MALRPRGKSLQKVSASDGPSPRPTISLCPSLLAATAIIYRGTRDDPASLAGFEVCVVQPEVGPVAGEWAVEEGAHPLIEALAQFGRLS